MRNLSSALKDVPDWETLGIRLGVSTARIKEISISRNREPCLCKMDLLDYWLTTDPDVSWERVATALDEMDVHKIAKDIRITYCCSSENSGTQMCRVYMQLLQCILYTCTYVYVLGESDNESVFQYYILTYSS